MHDIPRSFGDQNADKEQKLPCARGWLAGGYSSTLPTVDRIICNVTSFIMEAKILPIDVNGDIGSIAVSKRR